jgi:Ca2+-transporting ATPase
MMSTVHKTSGGIVQYTKGAPDIILAHCTTVLKNGQRVPMTEELKNEILGAQKEMSDRALRVLALAMKPHSAEPTSYEPEDLENELTFVGLTGMIDPVRPEVKAAIEKCRSAGIRPVMITGDHIDTAIAIAKELNILSDASQAITGAQLDEIPESEFENIVEME